MFIEGVEDDPDGIAMRQLPLISQDFYSALWVSEDGNVRRRYFNPFNKLWTWGNVLKKHVNENGDIFIYTGTNKIQLKKAIASAWLINSKERKVPKVKDPTEEVTSSNMYWTDYESDDLELENEEEEIWTPISLGDKEKKKTYEISSQGRFRNNLGETSNGTYVGSEKVICLPGKGTFSVQTMVDGHFSKNEFSKNEKDLQKNIPPRIYKLICALKTGESIEEYAENNKLGTSTVWSYMYDVFKCMTIDECNEIAKKIISAGAWKAMKHIFSEELEHIFSSSAKEYMKIIDSFLCDDPDWKCNPHRFEEIRLLKVICQKMN